jgi:hypothetical protein
MVRIPKLSISTTLTSHSVCNHTGWLKSREGVFHAYFLLLPVIFLFEKE